MKIKHRRSRKQCSDSAHDSDAYDLVKTELLESQVERKHSEGLRASIVIGLFFRASACDYDNLKMIFFNNDTSMGQRKNSESLTGIEPMASQIPVGRSNQLSYKRLVVSFGHLLG